MNLRNIRRETLPYFFGWVIIFTWLYCSFLPNGNLLFLDSVHLNGHQRILTYVWLIVCPLISVFSKGSAYVPKTVYSAAAALLCFAASLFFKVGTPFIICQLIIAGCVGHIFASCGFGFFMILNNTEKFYSMLLGIFLPKLLLLIASLRPQGLWLMDYPRLILLGCLLSMLLCAHFFRKRKNLVPSVGKKPFPKKAWSLMTVVFIILAFNDVVAPMVLFSAKASYGHPLQLWYFCGIAAGLLLVLLLQKGLKLNICFMLNFSTALLAIGFVVCAGAGEYPSAVFIASLCFGLAYPIGMVNIYYLAGFMAKKLQNLTFDRVGIVLSAVYYFCGYSTVLIFKNTLPIISILSVCVLIIFFAMSPLLMRQLYDGEWIDDSYRKDVTFESRLRSRLRELRLSPKESQICELLLQGFTLRQAAAMLEIAYSTANTYCTALYRKLNINSRAELTLLFKDFLD